MKLTSRSEYALLALVYLARHDTEVYLSVDSIAQAQGIPPKFLEQILLALKRAHFLHSIKGQHYESTPIEKEKSLTAVFKDIRDYVSNKLETTTIADVMD